MNLKQLVDYYILHSGIMMKRKVLQTTDFSNKIKGLIKAHRLNVEDFNSFKSVLAENPEMGAMIPGTGGVRKTRLKSASKGKSGGFRVCYYFHDAGTGEIFLIDLYAKNEQENITPDEKKELKAFANIIKRM